jgi:hypothetical protein
VDLDLHAVQECRLQYDEIAQVVAALKAAAAQPAELLLRKSPIMQGLTLSTASTLILCTPTQLAPSSCGSASWYPTAPYKCYLRLTPTGTPAAV